MLVLQCILFLIILILINCSTIDIELTTDESIANKVFRKLQIIEKELKQDEKQLKIDRETLEEEKQIMKFINNIDIIQLNIGGEIIMTTRQTLTKIPKSILSLLFNGRWEHKLQIDQNGNIFFDFNPIIFRHLLYQLQILDTNTQIHFYPPSQSSLAKPFKKMIEKLGLNQLSSLEKNKIITFNVGGQFITNRYETFNQVSNSTFDTIVLPSKLMNFNNQTNVFLDYDPKIFQHLLNQLRKESFKYIDYTELSLNQEKISFKNMLSDLNIFATTTITMTAPPSPRPSPRPSTTTTVTATATATTTTTTTTTTITTTTATTASITTSRTTTTTKEIIISSFLINDNTEWIQKGLTVAGGNGRGNQLNQLSSPHGIYVDDNHQCIYIVDTDNNRIVEWKYDAKIGQVVAGGNDGGNRMDQLSHPMSVIVDKKTDSLIICDFGNSRVVRWPRQNGRNGETIISDIHCRALAMDNNEDLYVADEKENEVRKWKIGKKTNGIIVAGGNGQGKNLNQLSRPMHIFIDKNYAVYVSDYGNARVMKWMKGAKEGIVVASGQGQGHSFSHLYPPQGVIADDFGNVYVADYQYSRIICWSKGSKEGRIIVGGKNLLNYPMGLSFDRQGNLYVVDWGSNRVQKFEIEEMF